MTFATIFLYLCSRKTTKMRTEKPLIYYLGQTVHLVKCQLIARIKECNIDLSIEHFIILNLIQDKGEITQQDIADHFQRDKSLVLRQVNTLILKSYLERVPDEQDRRKKILLLTPKGIEILEQLRQESMKLSNQLLKDVSEKELVSFFEVINKIQTNTGLLHKKKI